MNSKYTAKNFIIDILLTVLTGGLWMLWIFCRELRNIANSRR